MQLHRGRFKVGLGILGALVPAVVLAMVAFMALTPGQVRAESEPEAEEPAPVVCDGLYSLTMAVNTMTLKRMGELTKYSYSSDRECEMSLTLIDVSSDDNPADITKTCSVTATPVRNGYALDVTLTEAGDCGTVAIDVIIDYGGSHPAGFTLAQLSESEIDPSTDTTAVGPGQGGVAGQGSCTYTTEGDDPHLSSTNDAVSAHGWWTTPGVSWNCPSKADVTVVLQVWVCNPFGDDCYYTAIAIGRKRVFPGGGSARRATARAFCYPSRLISYQSIIDVDLVGQSDPPDVKKKEEDVRCHPYTW